MLACAVLRSFLTTPTRSVPHRRSGLCENRPNLVQELHRARADASRMVRARVLGPGLLLPAATKQLPSWLAGAPVLAVQQALHTASCPALPPCLCSNKYALNQCTCLECKAGFGPTPNKGKCLAVRS